MVSEGGKSKDVDSLRCISIPAGLKEPFSWLLYAYVYLAFSSHVGNFSEGKSVVDLPNVQRSAKRRGCLLSYSQAEPGRELIQPSPRLLAEPCIVNGNHEFIT